MSVSNYLEAAWLNTLRGGGSGASYTAPAAVYLKLHIGDAGEDGTANAAANTVRQVVTFGAAANPGGTLTSSVQATWTSVSTTETYSHWSMWDASTGGNCLWTGALSSSAPVTAGDTFQITSLVLSLD